MSGLYIDMHESSDRAARLEADNAKLRAINAALLAACKALRRWVDGPTAEEDFPRLAIVKIQADKAIAETES